MFLTPDDFSANVERFSGFADVYDQYRPSPPQMIGELLCRLAGQTNPDLVVDFGSGTGLSTRYWAAYAKKVVGIEPSGDMRRLAEQHTVEENVLYQEGFSHQTGLPDQCAQMITCSQSLHWMDPSGTFQEAHRILVNGGVFAAFDYDWPPTTGKWEADQAYEVCMQRVRTLEDQNQPGKPVRKVDKSQHLDRMKASGMFRYVKEVVVHHIDQGNAERLYGIALSQGGTMTLLKQGYSEKDLGLDQLKKTADAVLGNEKQDWFWSSRVRVGIK